MPTRGSSFLSPAVELRRAVELVERHAPPAFVNDIAEIRRRIGWILAGLDDARTCKRCGASFTFDAVLYARQRMPSPRTCPACRRRR
jgi:hypothetical protein